MDGVQKSRTPHRCKVHGGPIQPRRIVRQLVTRSTEGILVLTARGTVFSIAIGGHEEEGNEKKRRQLSTLAPLWFVWGDR